MQSGSLNAIVGVEWGETAPVRRFLAAARLAVSIHRKHWLPFSAWSACLERRARGSPLVQRRSSEDGPRIAVQRRLLRALGLYYSRGTRVAWWQGGVGRETRRESELVRLFHSESLTLNSA
jgi:hypothetical protein